MSQTVYTNYWVNRRFDQRKEHGSYASEEEAVEAIHTWWELHKEKYSDVEYNRTNTGALEVIYDDPNYFYRIEKRVIDGKLPSRAYKLKSKGEIEAARKQLNLGEEAYIFDELAEPYRDRLLVAMGDSSKVRNFVYTELGRPIVKVEEYKQVHQA